MANHDNSRFSYADVLNNEGYYMQDDNLRYSVGVETMQTKLNRAGFWCGTPDGKFGNGTNEAVHHFQRAYSLVVDGKAGYGTLAKLDTVSAASPGFSKTVGTYGVYFDSTNKRFMHNQQIVYQCLKNAGLSNYAIAGFIGNFEAEHQFKTFQYLGDSAFGIAQWETPRKIYLERYASAKSQDKTSINIQAGFVLEECKSGGAYADGDAVKCMNLLKNTATVNSVQKAADYVTALYERCHNHSSWNEALNCSYGSSRFLRQPMRITSCSILIRPRDVAMQRLTL